VLDFRQAVQCPLWVISGHRRADQRCPLYPESRHVQRRNRCLLCAISRHDPSGRTTMGTHFEWGFISAPSGRFGKIVLPTLTLPFRHESPAVGPGSQRGRMTPAGFARESEVLFFDLPGRVMRDVHGGIPTSASQCRQRVAGEWLAPGDSRVFASAARDDMAATSTLLPH
jgi:hypothetical protein